VVSSPSTRAAETVAPFATAQERKLRRKKGLSEEGHAADPTRAGHHLRRLLDRGEPAVLCSHRTVLPDVLAPLLERVDTAHAPGGVASSLVTAALEDGLAKGEALVAHVAGTGAEARVVTAERHRPGERDSGPSTARELPPRAEPALRRCGSPTVHREQHGRQPSLPSVDPVRPRRSRRGPLVARRAPPPER